MKINGYDESSGSLIVSFCSDTTASQNPADYPSFAYQPITMFPDITDVQEITQRLAFAGVFEAEMAAKKEAVLQDTARIDAFKALVGQEFEYNINDLRNTIIAYSNETVL